MDGNTDESDFIGRCPTNAERSKYKLPLSDYCTLFFDIFFIVSKFMNMERMNEKLNYTLHEYYYPHEVLFFT